jgi:hypothetical protein
MDRREVRHGVGDRDLNLVRVGAAVLADDARQHLQWGSTSVSSQRMVTRLASC